MKCYQINEVFFSLQGEGLRAGTANVFVRFSGCNLACSRDNEAGFDCDTEFVSGRKLNLDELWTEIVREANVLDRPWHNRWLILTGGEPGLQVNDELVAYMHARRVKVAIETNGTIELPLGIDWITVSPKSAEHTLKQLVADEVKYVRHYGQGIPRPAVTSLHKLISPAFVAAGEVNGVTQYAPDHRALEWCIKLVKENPEWRMSVQQHKSWNVR